jgi:hypothetical protein
MEKDLGYDVEFAINNGNFTRSLFLQHKISCYAEKRAGRNADFYGAHNGPYFRFPVDNNQHNTLCELSRTRGDAFYCAPRFHFRRDLETHYRANTIGTNSIWLNPLDVGEIQDNGRHNITYNSLGGNPKLHSEPIPFRHSFSGSKDNAPDLRRVTIDAQYVRQLSDELLHRSQAPGLSKVLTPRIRDFRPIEQAQLLLAHVFQVSWFLLP